MEKDDVYRNKPNILWKYVVNVLVQIALVVQQNYEIFNTLRSWSDAALP
jgi:hypothetical protein